MGLTYVRLYVAKKYSGTCPAKTPPCQNSQKASSLFPLPPTHLGPLNSSCVPCYLPHLGPLTPHTDLGPLNSSCPPSPRSSCQCAKTAAVQSTYMAHSCTAIHHDRAACSSTVWYISKEGVACQASGACQHQQPIKTTASVSKTCSVALHPSLVNLKP